jgi:hypothetical protein
MFRALTQALPLLLVCSLAGAATVWTPIACGCVDAWQSVAWGIGRKDLKGPDDITAHVIARGISKEFGGKVVRARDLPFTTSIHDCADASSPVSTIRCRWWLWESHTGMRGYDVTIQTTPSGIYQHVQVVPITWVDPSASR